MAIVCGGWGPMKLGAWAPVFSTGLQDSQDLQDENLELAIVGKMGRKSEFIPIGDIWM
jgi:hypothetical protein